MPTPPPEYLCALDLGLFAGLDSAGEPRWTQDRALAYAFPAAPATADSN